MKADIAIYGSHNASVALAIDGKIEFVMELERFLNHKNVGIFFYFSANIQEYILERIQQYITQHYGITEYENCIADYLQGKETEYFPALHYHAPGHHKEHAGGSLYQSPHDEALIFSFDGGGSDGFFNIYRGKKGDDIHLLQSIPLDLGFAYMSFGDRIDDIRHEPLWYGNLVYPGKLMGLCAYGVARVEWSAAFVEYYKSGPEGPTYVDLLTTLGTAIGVSFYPERIDGDLARDIAATSQRAFEVVFMEYAQPWMDEYPDLPVHMTGGCALNIILNTKLTWEREVFVTPNPNDCGLAVGMLCNLLKPTEIVDITYAGIPVLDPDILPSYCEKHAALPMDIEKIAHDLHGAKIIGVVRGRSEHGPRALGNRSILCDPAIPGMKDTLNLKVKHRESYRPFAPVVRLQDVNIYFEWNIPSRWMNFCPKVREEWVERLGAIVHADGTARIQTVTEDENPWLYELLTIYEGITGIGVLLNTSFNSGGSPIVASYSEAMDIYKREDLDRLLLGDFYFSKDHYFPPDFL